jgi:hypothetical protein
MDASHHLEKNSCQRGWIGQQLERLLEEEAFSWLVACFQEST